MKRIITTVALLFICGSLLAETSPGGYEMTTYYMVFLRKGPNWTATSTPETKEIQQAHLANIVRLQKEGKMAVAGPFMDRGDILGIFIYQNVTSDEAKALTETDPAVRAGRLVMEVHPWYAAKGLKVDPPAPPAPAKP
jgi:uncharacterized protein YciI